MKLSVFGGGSWGTALAHQMARRGHEVVLWAHEAEVVDGVNTVHRNPLFISDLDLDPRLVADHDLLRVAGRATVWLWAVPVQFSRRVMEQLTGALRSDVVIVSSSKGIETEILKRMDELAWEVLNLPASRFCCLSGPTFAREVILGHPSLAVIACPDLDTASVLQEEFSDHYLRCYAGTDLIGVELAGALKNVIAIAAGIIDGLGLGANTQAALMTRGLHEITRLGVAMGADASTFRGLAGMGDLVLTCTGELSRNRTLGVRLGKGEKLGEILASMKQVAEGVRNTLTVDDLARTHQVDMPITAQMRCLLFEDKTPRAAMVDLMTRQLKHEFAR
jgi:glycerol-3-phosphate dehydrogenase (NAD(P)+)